MMISSLRKSLVFFALLLMTPSIAVGAQLLVESGKLVGASGVLIGTRYFDVAFRDGWCLHVVPGCTSAFDFSFIFWDEPSVPPLASQALLDQVLVDGPLGKFDSEPQLIEGGLSSPT